jgi:AhpD family alkylhydroperoxidase
MTPRLRNPHLLAPEAVQAMMALEASFDSSTLELVLRNLVKLRASQMNGCAFCIHMHSTHLREEGVSEMKLYMLPAWRESTLYSDRERAALGWTESLTRLSETGAPDEDYAPVKAHFTDVEQVQLTMLIGAINVWNRLQVGFRSPHPVERTSVAA